LGNASITESVCAGAAIPLEYNIDWLNGVSYDKGCYVGQELVARVHFGGLVRKRLYPVTFQQPLGHSNVADVPVFIDDKDKSIGTLRGAQGVHGIAHLRISDVEASFKKSKPLLVHLDGSEVRLTPTIPKWWAKG
jgi:transferase CAF17, mitochondrial